MNSITDGGAPLWVVAYFAIYSTYCFWAHLDDLKTRRLVVVGIELVFSVMLIIPAAMYWGMGGGHISKEMGLLSYIVGCGAFVFQSVVGLKKNFPDPTLSLAANIGLSLAGLVLVCTMAGPAIWWGGAWISHAGVTRATSGSPGP